MLPEVRALADKLIYDVAMVKYIATGLPQGGLERVVPGGWSVRQVLAHVAASQTMYARALDRFLTGEEPLPRGWDPDRINAEAAEAYARARLPGVLREFQASREATFSCFEQLTEAHLASPFWRVPSLGAVLTAWSRHCEAHALDLVDALPGARTDPMVLNWILHADYSDSPERTIRQQRVFAEVREQLKREEGE